jgi:hypothetical protein
LTLKCLSPDLSVAIQNHPELVELVTAWATLPESMRAGIVAMIKVTMPADKR